MFRFCLFCFLALATAGDALRITGDESPPPLPVVNIHVDEPALGSLEARRMGSDLCETSGDDAVPSVIGLRMKIFISWVAVQVVRCSGKIGTW